MSKNEVLEVVSKFMDSVVTKDDLSGVSVGGWSEDDVRDLIHEEMLAVGVGANFEDELGDLVVDKVDEALDDYDFDRPIESYLQECDFVTKDDLDYNYVCEDDFDSYCADWADSYLEDRIDDWADDNLEERVDSVVNTYDWELVLSGSSIERRIKKLEAKLAMYEILELLDSVRG